MALKVQAEEQQTTLTEQLNQSDARLEVIRASLLSAEQRLAEASARAQHAETRSEELTHNIEAVQRDFKVAEESHRRTKQDSDVALAEANSKV